MAASKFSRNAGKLSMMKKESRFVLRALAVTSPNVCEPRRNCNAFPANSCGCRTKSGGGSPGTCTTPPVRTLSLWQPPMLDEAGLEDAIRDYASGFTERTGIEVEVEISPHLGRMIPDVEVALFRVVQESLTNIQRHSGSPQARIRIDRDPAKITLEIGDKGNGISGNLRRRKAESPFGPGVGIPSMHERVKLIGGHLEIESSNSGTTVRVTIPIHD